MRHELPTMLLNDSAHILLADDDALQGALLSEVIRDMGHRCTCVANGLVALEKVKDNAFDLIIADVVMPGMNGFEATRRLKADPMTSHIPVLIITSLSDRASKHSGLECGADELLSKPVDEAELRLRIRNLLKIKKYADYLKEHGRQLESEVTSKSLELERAFEKIRKGYVETVYRLTLAAEHRDKETGGHIKRISLYTQLMARYIGLDEQTVEAFFLASPMHDVGKIGIPDAVLLKEGGHTPEEAGVMRTHTLIGASILDNPGSEILSVARDIALSHHENWDGSGYPRGLKGVEIPLSGRIVHLVDIYDALRSKRPYKNGHSHERACAMMAEESWRFDPALYSAFLDSQKEFRRLYDEYAD